MLPSNKSFMPNSAPVCAIVLAAGESHRMGQQKLLLPYGGKPVIRHVVDEVVAAGATRTIVVTGFDHERIIDALTDTPAEFTRNTEFAQGMLSSVRCGLRHATNNSRGYMIALGDQPSITASVVQAVLAAFAARLSAIVVPSHNGRQGHPIIIPSRFHEDILSKYDDTGLRGLLRAHPDAINYLDIGNDAVLRDIDFPEDYARELELLSKN